MKSKWSSTKSKWHKIALMRYLASFKDLCWHGKCINFSPNHFHVNTQSAFSERKRVLSLAKILRPTRQKSIKFNTRRLINVQSQKPLIYHLFFAGITGFYLFSFIWLRKKYASKVRRCFYFFLLFLKF